ncbi:Si-specific NAD(P)(+) transhydrogenase [bacterium]|nr:Si-specific NAD(P)(+) transhydrogenase [bacterium]
MNFDYDIAIIGSGPAGQRAAVQSAKLGKKVIVIEKELIGGSCLHHGTIPSKTLREAVLLENKKKSNFLAQVMKRKRAVVDGEVSVIQDQLKRNKVKFSEGAASFTSPTELSILQANGRKKKISAKHIVIATGTRPRRPDNIPFSKNVIMESDSVLDLKKSPRSICILGAGVIGCEYASIFLEMGVKVTLVDRRLDLLRGIDREIVEALSKDFQSKGLKLLLGVDYKDIKKEKAGASILLDDKRTKFETILFCMGRVGNTEELKLENARVECNERGLINVNAQFQSSCPNIYAVGDIIGTPSLAASAYEQGRLAACHAFEGGSIEFPKLFPYGIYTIPEISSVGAEESQLLESKIPFVIGRAKYKELARGKILGDEFGFVKLLFHKETQEILGAHIIGTHATELIHIGQMAIQFKAKVEQFTAMVFNYPTLAEAYKVACLNAYNQMR